MIMRKTGSINFCWMVKNRKVDNYIRLAINYFIAVKTTSVGKRKEGTTKNKSKIY